MDSNSYTQTSLRLVSIMVWFDKRNSSPGLLLEFCFRVFKAGNLPKHVAFIMDGNRRFAKKQHLPKKEGHSRGFEKLTEVLQWCYELDIPEVSVYAFSIENFKRSEEEVNTLMEILKEKLEKILEEKDMVMKYGVCFRFIGDVSLFNDELKKVIAKVVELTHSNNKSFLNVAIGYTSRDEITQAIREVASGVNEGKIKESDISEDLLEKCFYTSECRPVDLLIRTSGEVRLSDYLLWQFCDWLVILRDYGGSFTAKAVLWPELSVWNFFKCILKYQLGYRTIENAKELTKLKNARCAMESDLNEALIEMKGNCDEALGADLVNTETYAQNRKKRCDEFVQDLRNKRLELTGQYLTKES